MELLKHDCSEVVIGFQDFERSSLRVINLVDNPSVGEVAHRLGVNVETILNILGLSRKDILSRNYRSFKLSDDHLEVLANAYIKSAKRHLKRKPNVQKAQNRPIRTLFEVIELTISAFKTCEPCYSLRSISDLDEDILRAEFFNRIYSSVESESYSSLNKIFSRYKIRLITVSKDIRKRLFSLIVSNHYHIFPSEEDSMYPKKALGYSTFFFIARVAELNKHFNSNLQWKNIKYSLIKYRTVIYPLKISQLSLAFFPKERLILTNF